MRDRNAIHPVYGAGRWFPSGRDELARLVDTCIDDAAPPPLAGRLFGVTAPHAGFVYSGGVAGHAYRALRDHAPRDGFEAVLILGFSHRERFPGLALLPGAAVATPLGALPLHRELTDALCELAHASACLDAAPHAGEHSAENQLPFLQRALPDTPAVVGLFGEATDTTRHDVADALVALAARRRIAVVASTDLLHDPDWERVRREDARTLAWLEALDGDALRRRCTPRDACLCGLAPVGALLEAAARNGCPRGTLLAYRNSGDDHPASRGQWVVGYGAVAYTLPAPASA